MIEFILNHLLAKYEVFFMYSPTKFKSLPVIQEEENRQTEQQKTVISGNSISKGNTQQIQTISTPLSSVLSQITVPLSDVELPKRPTPISIPKP